MCYREERCPDSCDRRWSLLQRGMSRFMCLFLKRDVLSWRRNGKHRHKSPGIFPVSVLSLFYCRHHSPESQQATSREQARVSCTPAQNMTVLRRCEKDVFSRSGSVSRQVTVWFHQVSRASDVTSSLFTLTVESLAHQFSSEFQFFWLLCACRALLTLQMKRKSQTNSGEGNGSDGANRRSCRACR